MMTTIGSLVSLLLVQESTGKLVELIALQQGQEMRQGTVETSEFVAGGIVRQAGLVNDRSAVEVRLNLDEELDVCRLEGRRFLVVIVQFGKAKGIQL
jgi:hypothetical protein